ncbi:MAG TPA: hypothetical protein VHQ90_13520 [Thermoanaerobaculia bacterium]|nr:hypothetical protein [Thermoanaerobaculia bacterium]
MPTWYRVNERRWRRHGGAALCAMALMTLMALLLAVACENNSVDESVPSGARPAPLPKTGRAHLVSPPAHAGEPSRAGLELPESHAPRAGTAASEGPGRAAAAHHARGSEEAANGHLSATGDLAFEGDVAVSCSVFSAKGFEIGFDSRETPQVILRIDDFLGPGTYQAGALVRAAAAHGLLESAGRATVQLKVARTDRPHDGSLVSGSFTGAYAGRAGEGTISGRIDGCFYDGVLP